MKKCKIDGCENKSYCRDWCSKHYICWLKYGDPIFTKHHGYRNHPLYNVWCHMKNRCYNLNFHQYKDYGGRGITVCDEWKNSAKTFIEWALENRWKPGLQIDRRNNNGNYIPENCEFVTPKENMHNQRLLRENNTSGYCGVNYHIGHEKWCVRISINGKRKHIGYFDLPEEAAIAYDKAVPDNRPKNFI